MTTRCFRTGVALAASLLWAGAARAADAQDDRAFLDRARGVNELELRLGQLATERSQTPEGRAAARKMVENHTAIGKRLAELARRAGSTGSPQLSTEQQATLARVSAAPEGEFDATFKRTVDAGHVDELAMYRGEVDRAADPDLRALASERVTALQKAVAGAGMSPASQGTGTADTR